MKIIGTGSAVPHQAVTNEMLSKFLDTDDKWIRTRTGIHERRVLTTETIEELAIKAAKAAMQDANISASDIDYVLCSSVQSSDITPALACIVQGEIGAVCPALDINGACAGFVYALDIAESFLKSGQRKNILLVCAENVSRMADWTERETCVLFGDGAGAMVLTEGDALKAMKLTSECKRELLYEVADSGNSPYFQSHVERGYLTMNGKEVFKYAVENTVNSIGEILEKTGHDASEIDYFIMHQANVRIIKAICLRVKQGKDRFPYNLDKYGNTSSASIPILLDEMRKDGRLKKGNKLVLSAFGAGMVTGTCLLEWQI